MSQRTHACRYNLWRLADRAAAEPWLADHPGQPNPAENGRVSASQGSLLITHTTNEPTPMVAATGVGMED